MDSTQKERDNERRYKEKAQDSLRDSEDKVSSQKASIRELEDRNAELNHNVDKLQERIQEVTSSMHGEQEEWLQKYHDQIDKRTKLEERHKVIQDEAQAKYD